MGRHPYHDVPSEKRGDPRGAGAPVLPSTSVIYRMCQRHALECRTAAQAMQAAARDRDNDALDMARTTFYDALAREEEWVA